MRKRKRGCGTYFDEGTGETTIVQTTKQAKRNHQRSGKWYKEPSEREIRAWDREDARRNAADKALQREQNKKANAVKRAEAAAKEQQLKSQLYHAGKITFTQTLAKKDEDQLNLHSWFKGNLKPKVELKHVSGRKEEKVSTESNEDTMSTNRTVTLECKSVSGSSTASHNNKIECNTSTDTNLNSTNSSSDKQLAVQQSPFRSIIRHHGTSSDPFLLQAETNMVIDLEYDLQSMQDFDIAEDDTAGNWVPEETGLSEAAFKSSELSSKSTRIPLSPMSISAVNIRASQLPNVSQFNSKLAQMRVGATTRQPTGTQTVHDMLASICTQDLVDDLEDMGDENYPCHGKENAEPPSSPVKALPHAPGKSSPLKQIVNIDTAARVSFADSLPSSDYDDLFGQLAEGNNVLDDENFDDDELDEATLLSLPVSQITNACQAKKPFTISTPPAVEKTSPTTQARSRKTLQKVDSFAIEGLDDQDLLEELEHYERSQARGITDLSTT